MDVTHGPFGQKLSFEIKRGGGHAVHWQSNKQLALIHVLSVCRNEKRNLKYFVK
jgi:hypothetical protein